MALATPLRISLVVVATFALSTTAFAYQSYQPSSSTGCYQCHGGFDHGMHVGSNDMTNNCLLCHNSIGDNPDLDESGQGVSCIGCHLSDGLRAHHAAVGAPADNAGLFCNDCHGTANPQPEGTLPPYYSRNDVNLSDPCLVDPGLGGEDWNNDGQGLDNDGNLLYEADDPGCGTTDAPDVATTFRLLPCSPNPFNPSTMIRFVLPSDASVRLDVFDLEGRRVVTLAEGIYQAGQNEVAWNGRDEQGLSMPSGTYVCRLEAGEYRATTRMALLK